MYWIIGAIALVPIGFIIYKAAVKLNDKRVAGNVIKMTLNPSDKKYANRQKCSFCHQKSKKLYFYANEYGKAIGLCDKCRPIAERRALLRL